MRIPRFISLPRTKPSHAVNDSRRLRIDGRRGVFHRHISADRFEQHALQIETKRCLGGVLRQDHQRRLIDQHFLENDARPTRLPALVGPTEVQPFSLGRNINLHPIQRDLGHEFRRLVQHTEVEIEPEVSQAEHRGYICSSFVPQYKSVAFNMNHLPFVTGPQQAHSRHTRQADTKRFKFNIAVKAISQILDRLIP